MSQPLDLLAQSRRLARMDPRRPKQANLRRAVSSAYYGLFHFLIDQAARNMVGTQTAEVAYRHVIMRAFDHGSMKTACRSFAGGQLPHVVSKGLPPGFLIPAALRHVAQVFVDLQESRHLADYDLSSDFRRSDVLVSVQQVEQAIAQFNQLQDRTIKKFFLTCLLAWKSLSNR